mgnify:FL=1
MRRFEYIHGNQAKFWQVERKGAVLTVASGKIGKSPKTRTKQLADYMAAEQEFDRLIRDHLRRGYVEVAEATPPEVPMPDRTVVLRTMDDELELEMGPRATAYIVWRMVEVEVMDKQVEPPDLQRWAYRASRRLRLDEIPSDDHEKYDDFVDMFMELSQPDRAGEAKNGMIGAYKLADGSEWIVTAKESGILAEASAARLPKRHKISNAQQSWLDAWTEFNRAAVDRGGYLVELISEE